MSKICKSCGKYYEGEYCEHCGYGNKDLKTKAADKYKKIKKPVRFMTEEEVQEYYEKLKKENEQKALNKKAAQKSNKILLIVIAVVAIGIVIGGLIKSGVLSRGEKTDVIYDYFEAISDRDFDDYIDCFPSEIKDELKKDREEADCSKKEYMDKLVEIFNEECGDGITITAKCGKAKKLEDSEYNMEGYKTTYGTAPDISEAYVISTKATVRGSKNTKDIQYECYVGKVNGRWKLFNVEENPGTITPEMVEESK